MLDEAKMRRLAMIQYLYTIGIDQSHKPEPLNMISILHFHDAVELFLALASEYLDAGKTGKEFMAYWEAINQKLPSKDFAQKDSMSRLNSARANWKHYGIRLSTTEIEDFRSNVTSFFYENTPKIFGFSFEQISMTFLVQDEEVRDRLLKAESLNSTGEVKKAIQEAVIAFQDLFNRFDGKAWTENNRMHLRGFTSRSPFSRIEHEAPKELSRFAQQIEKDFNDLHEQVRLLSLGVDYKRYIRFKWLTPIIHYMASNEYQAFGTGNGQSQQDYIFCYHFVIECALRLQELQFP